MKTGYLISTHPAYIEPLKRLLDSMFKHGVAPADIFIASGGNMIKGIPTLKDFRGCKLIEVEHNSFDYTALIEAVLLEKDGFFQMHTHLFLLQDTMEFGPRTHELICAADPEKWATAAFGGQCNLVLFQYDYLLTMREYIFGLRNLTKREAVHREGELWKMLQQNLSHRHEASYANSMHEVIGTGNPYSDIERIKEYYAGIDLVKWKSNWGQNMGAMIERP